MIELLPHLDWSAELIPLPRASGTSATEQECRDVNQVAADAVYLGAR